ncbi:hypothetical protein D3C75_554210 [compost metagenome]
MDLFPLAFGRDLPASLFVERQLHFIQAAAQVLFGDITELEARQRGHGLAQRAQEQLPLQTVAVSGRAVQVVAGHVESDVIRRRNGCFLRGQIERHALRHKVFDMEIPQPLLVIAGAGANVPHARLRSALKLIVEAIEAVVRLADHRTRHLPVRAQHLQLDRLIRQRFAVAVAQQSVEDHRFARAIEIARAKHKELLAEAWRTANSKLRQIQRRQGEVQQRGLPVLAGQQ